MAARYPLVWNLKGELPHPEAPEFEAVFRETSQRLTSLADRAASLPRPTLEDDALSVWETFLGDWQQTEERVVDLNAYMSCYAAEQAENKTFQKWEAQLSTLDPLRERIDTDVEFLLRDLGDAEFASWSTARPALRDVAYILKIRRRNAALRLPREQENLAAELAVDGLHAWGRLYDRLSGKLKVEILENGELVKKSPGQVTFDAPERLIREHRFHAADKAWATLSVPCAEALNHIAGVRLTRYRRLGLKDHLEAPLAANRMSRETLETMWGCITDRKPMLLDYMNRKANLLGIEHMAWFDQSAPLPSIPGLSSDRIPYAEGCEQIIVALTAFDPDFGAFAGMALRDGWIEAENRSGKRQGGFCTSMPSWKQSRIFMTYLDSPDSLSTLVHELGHAYHSWVLRDEPVFQQDYPMNLAETASTFAEAVLAEWRLARTTSSWKQLQLLDDVLGDSVAFLMNIHARFLFEDEFHRERVTGEVSSERLDELMTTAQKSAYLDAFGENGWNPRFWVSKLHFYITRLPFYNFPYTFGYLLSLGLYAIGQQSGRDFPARYRKFLQATGSADAEDAVRDAFGFDLRKPEFWNLGLDFVASRVARFGELSDRLAQDTAKM